MTSLARSDPFPNGSFERASREMRGAGAGPNGDDKDVGDVGLFSVCKGPRGGDLAFVERDLRSGPCCCCCCCSGRWTNNRSPNEVACCGVDRIGEVRVDDGGDIAVVDEMLWAEGAGAGGIWNKVGSRCLIQYALAFIVARSQSR